jgi:hypothetical protein
MQHFFSKKPQIVFFVAAEQQDNQPIPPKKPAALSRILDFLLYLHIHRIGVSLHPTTGARLDKRPDYQKRKARGIR